MSEKIIIITSCSVRHIYFANKLLDSLKNRIEKIIIEGDIDPNFGYKKLISDQNILKNHFIERNNSELDFFSDSIGLLQKKSKITNIKKGEINNDSFINHIIKLSPKLIITYGCSIIKPKLINFFRKKIINIHLGISPYYRGAGTNFHALVNRDFHLMGFSIIYMDEKIDTGEVIHQSRADFYSNDTPHTSGNRLIKKMTLSMIDLIRNFKKIEFKTQIKYESKFYLIKDANINKTKKLYKNFNKDLASYMIDKEKLESSYPIIKQDFIKI